MLLHRLLALGVPWGSVEEGRGTSGTFRETWSLRWEPELAVAAVVYALTMNFGALGLVFMSRRRCAQGGLVRS